MLFHLPDEGTILPPIESLKIIIIKWTTTSRINIMTNVRMKKVILLMFMGLVSMIYAIFR